MYLSNFQKDVVRSISQEKIKTILDFLTEFDLVISNVSEKKGWQKEGKTFVEGESDFFFNDIHYKVGNREDAYKKIIDFRKVINLLSKAELIEIEETADLSFGFLISEDRPKEIIEIINSSRNSFIITYNEIRKFEKDFLTPQERIQRRQLWIPIAVAVVTILLSSVLNYFTYTKEREVIIKNSDAFKDTLYIKIINNIDSSMSKNKYSIDSSHPQHEKITTGKELEGEK